MPPIKRKNYQQNLPPNFLQVHHSYIVNMDKVLEIERARIVMDKETRIPVGDNYKEDFMRYLKNGHWKIYRRNHKQNLILRGAG